MLFSMLQLGDGSHLVPKTKPTNMIPRSHGSKIGKIGIQLQKVNWNWNQNY